MKMKVVLVLTSLPPPPPIPKPHLLLLLLPRPYPNPNPNPNPNHNYAPSISRRILRRCRRSWFSNAEEPWSDGTRRRWWSDEDDLEFDEEDTGELFEDPWERVWFLKVFKSYGYLLPVVIGSMLIATGPKAFLMALALPLGQSAVSFAMDAIWGKDRDRQRRRPFARSDYRDYTEQAEEESKGAYKRRQSYQSWVANNADSKGSDRKTSFGGWDELDEETKSSSGSAPRTGDAGLGAPMRRLSRMGKYREVPLFMRLLVAVFPFLGSWFRIL